MTLMTDIATVLDDIWKLQESTDNQEIKRLLEHHVSEYSVMAGESRLRN